MISSKQIIPFFCIIIIIKSPTLLFVFLVLFYLGIQQSGPNIPSVDISNSGERARTSCFQKNKLLPDVSQTRQNKSLPELVMDDEDTSNSSLDFERFPPCPTTLPRLDTHFNFVEDTNHIDKTKSTGINWTAIHQELEYDQQREEIMHEYKGIPVINSILIKKSLAFGSQDKLKQISEYTQPLSPPGPSSQEYETEQDDINAIGPVIQPTKSTSAQLGNRFRKAVNKIKQTTNKTAGPGQYYKSPQINRSHDDLATILPHSSASSRIHDRFKVKLNKLLKK